MLSDTVGREIRAYREAADLTRDQVAGLCSAKGWPEITSTVLHYLESGRPDQEGRRRREITVDELAALACVLDVPPLALLAPLDQKQWPGLPQRLLNTTTAVAWLRGDRRLPEQPGLEVDTAAQPAPVFGQLRQFVRADALAQDIRRLLAEWIPAADSEPNDAEASRVEARPPGWAERYDAKLQELRRAREHLRDMGNPLPTLPLGLEWVDASPGDDSDG